MPEQTAEERARSLVTEFVEGWEASPIDAGGSREEIELSISRALTDYAQSFSNRELEKCRAMEARLANIQAGGPLIVCEVGRTQLKVWNEKAQRWAVTDMIFDNSSQKS